MIGKVRSITQIGCYWHQRSTGNSYTSCAVLLNGELLLNTPVTYGYGNFCFQRAGEYLLESGRLHGWDGKHLYEWCENQEPLPVSLYRVKFYVPTEKELDRFAEGKGQRVSLNG